jgi:hypothetical protein
MIIMKRIGKWALWLVCGILALALYGQAGDDRGPWLAIIAGVALYNIWKRIEDLHQRMTVTQNMLEALLRQRQFTEDE